jgi:hypothetical protein
MCNLHYLGNFSLYGRPWNTHQCTVQHHSLDISIVYLLLLCLLHTIHCIVGLHFFSVGGFLLEIWWSISLWMMLSPSWWPDTTHSTEYSIKKPSMKPFLNLGYHRLQKMQRSRWYHQNHSCYKQMKKALCILRILITPHWRVSPRYSFLSRLRYEKSNTYQQSQGCT